MEVIDGRVVARLSQSALGFPAGALVAWSLADIAAGRRATPELVIAPTERQAIEEAGATKNGK